MPPRQTKGAQRSSAQDLLASKGGAPDGLASFLGGFLPGAGGSTDPSSPLTATPQQEQDGAIAMNLRLLTKSSEITKQKSLVELITRVGETREDSLPQFVPSIVEAVIRHTHHTNPQIRTLTFTLLKTLMGRGKAVKMALVSDLAALAPAWVMAMNDMEANVRREATDAFEAAFSADKRPAMLLRYNDAILRTLFDEVTAIGLSTKQLADDQLDERANTLFSALRALGYMVKQVSASQTAVLAFVLESPAFAAVLPTRAVEKKTYIAAKTPLVRSSTLSLLRDVTTVCPCTPKIHQLVARAVQGSILDTDPTIAARVWELLLFWCRANVVDVITHLPPQFLDEVVDSFMACTRPELADVIFPSLFPLLTQLTKDVRLSDVLDEFCGALVEKIRLLGETPNVSTQEVAIVFQALMECWELHCVRKKSTESATDSEELFTVILTNLCTLLLAPAKRRRYETEVQRILCLSLVKTATRNEAAFRNCMAVLLGEPGAPFTVLPHEAEAGLVASYHHLRAVTVGGVYRTAVQMGTYSRQLPTLEGYVARMIQSSVAAKDTASLVGVLEGAAGVYTPPAAVRESIVTYLIEVLGRTGEAVDAHGKSLLVAVLEWDDQACTERLTACTEGGTVAEVQSLLREHLLKDPTKAFDLLVLACERNTLDDVPRCAAQLRAASLTQEQTATLLQAVTAGLAECLHRVKGDDAAMEQERAAAAAYAEGSSSASSDASDDDDDDSSDDEDSSTSDSGSSDDSGSETSEESDASSASSDGKTKARKGEGEVANAGDDTLLLVVAWCEALQHGSDLASILQLTGEVFSATLAPYLYKLTAALAPVLLPEYYVSIKALRAALASPSPGRASDGTREEFDPLAALEAKVHALRTDGFHELVTVVEGVLASYAVPEAERDAFAAAFMRDTVAGAVPLCYQAALHLQQVTPFASRRFFATFVASVCGEGTIGVRPAVEEQTAATTSEQLSLFTGYFPLAGVDARLGSIVRSAQVLRLMESVSSNTTGSPTAPATQPPSLDLSPQVVAHYMAFLLQAAAAKEVFSDGTCTTLFRRLLPHALERLSSKEAVEALVALLVGDGSAPAHLLVTLAAVFRDVARLRYGASAAAAVGDAEVALLLCGRRIVSAVTAAAVDTLFTSSGARGVTADVAVVYSSFYSIMDDAANTLRDNMLAQLPKPKEALLIEACMMLPSWDKTTAKLALVLHRHLGSMPVIAESTVKSLLQYAQSQSPIDCLELLAEMSMSRILSLPSYGEVVRVVVHTLCRCYTLRHLPSNGRLPQLPSDQPPPPPLPFTQLRRIAVAAAVARRGVVIHCRSDDVLRSTVNLVVFDAVCEAVSRLRSTAAAEVPLLAQLIASTSDFMRDLLTSDVAVLRASEASVRKLSSVLCYAYLWVSVTPIARLEAVGFETVAAVMRCVCQLANLTLVRSGTALQEAMRPILAKAPLRPLRESFASSEPLKMPRVRRQNTLIGKTQKQRLLLFPYLLAWAISLTAASAPVESAEADKRSSRERRAEICGLLDLLLCLLFTPSVKQRKGARVEETFIGSAIGAASGGGSGAGEGGTLAGMLGFEVVALTRTDTEDPMAQLARGAASVFTLLLHGSTLSHVTDWIDTLERKLQALLHEFAEVYVSPTLMQENLLAVLSHSPDGANTFNTSDEMTVSVSTAQRTISLCYEMEDAKVVVAISFPASYPLRKPRVTSNSGREVGISTEKWRAWMLKMTTMLFSGGSSTWDCVELFQRNLDAHLGGQEPCPICFAVVNAINHKLPDARCSVCHNSTFHSSCLYTWWVSSGQNVCPLCRSPWISE